MNTHNCGRLASCLGHPRWNVTKTRRDGQRFPWHAWAPGNGSSRDDAFRTHEEAVAYATAQARRTQLAAIQGATP